MKHPALLSFLSLALILCGCGEKEFNAVDPVIDFPQKEFSTLSLSKHDYSYEVGTLKSKYNIYSTSIIFPNENVYGKLEIDTKSKTLQYDSEYTYCIEENVKKKRYCVSEQITQQECHIRTSLDDSFLKKLRQKAIELQETFVSCPPEIDLDYSAPSLLFDHTAFCTMGACHCDIDSSKKYNNLISFLKEEVLLNDTQCPITLNQLLQTNK